MAVAWTDRVWKESAAEGGARLVLLALAHFANDDGDAWPSVPSLAGRTRMTERNVQLCLRQLQTTGEITLSKGGGRSVTNRYRITLKGEDLSPKLVHPSRETVKSATEKGEKHDIETVKPASPDTSVGKVNERSYTLGGVRAATILPVDEAFIRELGARYGTALGGEHVVRSKVARLQGARGYQSSRDKRTYLDSLIQEDAWKAQHERPRVLPMTAKPRPIGAPPDVPADSPFLKYVG